MILKPLLRLIYRLNRLRWRIVRPILIGVRLIIERDGAVMLVRHTYQPGWYLPGGGLKRDETLEQAARREAAEESGAVLGALRFFGVYSNFVQHKSDHIVVFACDDFHLTEKRSIEIESVVFLASTASRRTYLPEVGAESTSTQTRSLLPSLAGGEGGNCGAMALAAAASVSRTRKGFVGSKRHRCGSWRGMGDRRRSVA